MPARFSHLARIIRQHYGLEVAEPTSGSHWKVYNPATGISFRVKAHNGLKSELADVYVNGLARTFRIPKTELWKLLRD